MAMRVAGSEIAERQGPGSMSRDTQQSLSPEAEAGAMAEAAPLHVQIERQREEIAVLQATVRRLQAEVRGLQGSLSWKVTRPLRALARGLPGPAAAVQRI
ncbi:hypothetical protein, partial [Microvirga sp. Mcv34]|uniref:hypothetical protein n=1 Tax=Microvirga sp. Mcv34 TaxID=2926016 RepID=UPI0021CA446C